MLSPAERGVGFTRRRFFPVIVGGFAAVGACDGSGISQDRVQFRFEGEIQLPQAAPAAESVPARELLQSNLPKIFPVKVQISEESPDGVNRGTEYGVHRSKEEGWKWVVVQLGFENAGRQGVLAGLTREEMKSMTVQTHEGFQYGNTGFAFSPLNHACSRGFTVRIDEMGQRSALGDTDRTSDGTYELPPGFKITGYVSHGQEYPAFQACFKVAQNTSGYRLVVPGFPEIDLEKELTAAGQMKFPTDHPDSDFKELGETITIPGQGKMTLLEFRRDGYKVRFENESQGYAASLTFGYTVVDTQGVWWTHGRWSPTSVMAPDVMTVGPGLSEEFVKTFKSPLSQTIRGGKLLCGGNINQIFNLRFG
ncbi:MAG: hypothetical protein Q7S60_05075 [bacterium]|nr:hypothetical protein [bacterium]